jgi:hypothetical protein
MSLLGLCKRFILSTPSQTFQQMKKTMTWSHKKNGNKIFNARSNDSENYVQIGKVSVGFFSLSSSDLRSVLSR